MPITRRTATVELADGRVVDVRITNPDSIRYEQTAQRHGWPGMTIKDGTATVQDYTRKTTFEAWAALKRTGQYDGPWERFESTDCVDLDVAEEEVPPTPTDLDSDSSPSWLGSDDDLSTSSLEPTTT